MTKLRELIGAPFLVAGAIGLVACGPSWSNTPIAGTQSGITTVLMLNQVRNPYRLERISLAVDRSLDDLELVPPVPPGGSSTTAARLPLAPGEHVVIARAIAISADSKHIELQTMQVFRVAKAPAVVTATVGMSKDGTGLDMVFTVTGAELVHTSRAAEIATCSPKTPLLRAICVTELRLMEAERDKDAVLATCLHAGLSELRALARFQSPDSDPRSRKPDEAEDAMPQALRLGNAVDDRFWKIEQQLSQCVGQMDPSDNEVRVIEQHK